MQGKYAEAEPLCERSQAIREKALGPEHSLVFDALNTRAVLLDKQVQPFRHLSAVTYSYYRPYQRRIAAW